MMPTKSTSLSTSHVDREKALAKIVDSAQRGDLVAIIGTGVSMGLTDGRIPALSWKGLILNGLEHGVKKGKISHKQAEGWIPHIHSEDVDEVLSAAEFITQRLNATSTGLYARWLENVFKGIKPTNKTMEAAVRNLQRIGIPLCTLNYDSLLETVTGLQTVNFNETQKVAAWMRKETQTIFHLHGSWESPATCVLGIRDYEKTLSDTVRDLVQRSLASLKRLLFIGCSGTFADPNFSRLVAWLRKEIKTAAPEHFALVMDDEIDARNRDAAWQEFVEPLSYGNRRDRLAPFLLEIFSRSSSSDERQDQRLSTPVLPNSRRVEALPEYRDPPSDTLIDSDIETAHRGEAESSPPKPTDWYGFTIASPTEGASVGKTINLNGTYRKVPPDKRVVIIEYVPQDGDYWFKDGPIRFRRDNHWFARIDIGGTRKERVLQLAVLGPDGQALMDYYFQVASKNIWIGVKKLTADTVSCGEVTVIFRRR